MASQFFDYIRGGVQSHFMFYLLLRFWNNRPDTSAVQQNAATSETSPVLPSAWREEITTEFILIFRHVPLSLV